MTAEYTASLAPHPWDAVGEAPKLSGAYPDNDPAKITARTFYLTFSYDATVEVLDAGDLTDDEIEDALREAHADDINHYNPANDRDVDVFPAHEKAKPDYTVRIVDGRAETV